MEYTAFLEEAKKVFAAAQNEEMFDMNGNKLVQTDFKKGLILGRLNGANSVAVKIMVGTKEQINEAFGSG